MKHLVQVFTYLLLKPRSHWLYFEPVLFSTASNVVGSLVAFSVMDSILFVSGVKQVFTVPRNKVTIKVLVSVLNISRAMEYKLALALPLELTGTHPQEGKVLSQAPAASGWGATSASNSKCHWVYPFWWTLKAISKCSRAEGSEARVLDRRLMATSYTLIYDFSISLEVVFGNHS